MIDRDKFLEILDQLALNSTVPEPSPYSGRAMYGKQCISLASDETSEWDIAMQVGWMARCEGLDPRDFASPSVDALGRGFVLYWPRYEWPEGRPDPDAVQWDDDDEDQPA